MAVELFLHKFDHSFSVLSFLLLSTNLLLQSVELLLCILDFPFHFGGLCFLFLERLDERLLLLSFLFDKNQPLLVSLLYHLHFFKMSLYCLFLLFDFFILLFHPR